MPTFLTNRVEYNESIINALLVLSSLFGMIELVSLLIQDFGAKFNYDNEQPLRLAAKYAHYKIVDYLIDKGSDIHVLNERVFTYICENGDIERIQWFIDNDVNVKVVGAIPLLTASREGNFDVVKILFENGAPLAYDHFSPFHAAIFNGHLSIVQYFFQVRHHLPINRGLISAARGGNIEVAEYLLTKGASINAFHNSPVIFAAENCRAEMVQFLLKGYISPHLRFFGRLFRQSVDINAQDGRVLDGAIRIMCIPVVKVLVNAGINPEFTKRAYLKIQSGFYNIDHFQLNANYNTDRERIAKILEKYNESL